MLSLFIGLAAATANVAAPVSPTSRPLAAFEATQSGQPILLPEGPVTVSVSETTIPPGGTIAAHKHPFQRYAYVLAGRVRVTNLDTGAVAELSPGDFGVEARGQWHQGEALGATEVRLLVIDQAPPGQANMVRRDP